MTPRNLAELALRDLLLHREIAMLEAAAVAVAHVAVVFGDGVEHRVRIGEIEADRLLAQHRFAEAQRRQHRLDVRVLGGRYDHCIDVRMCDDIHVVG